MIKYSKIIRRYGITPLGVIHVGGFWGTENKAYRGMGFDHRLFIEAQPDTFAKLKDNLEGTGAYCEEGAASSFSGSIDFHILSNFGMSSSTLPPKRHLDVYPSIVEVDRITVEAIRIDDLLKEKYADKTFNFMNVDVQGAELAVLEGATETLKTMDFLNLEVNFDELYEGAVHISKLDQFLAVFDFVRVDTVIVHPTWGDAIWVKNKFTRARPAPAPDAGDDAAAMTS